MWYIRKKDPPLERTLFAKVQLLRRKVKGRYVKGLKVTRSLPKRVKFEIVRLESDKNIGFYIVGEESKIDSRLKS